MLVQTETGPQFLMQLNNRYLNTDELSIHVFMNGFSFCTKSKISFFDFKSNELNTKTLKNWIKLKNISFSKNKLIIFNHQAAIIPKMLFDKNKTDQYLNTTLKLKKEIVKYDVLDQTEQVVVYCINNSELKILSEIYPSLKTKHFITILLEKLSIFSKGNSTKMMYINLRENFFDLFIYQGTQLLFYNSFEQKNEEDFMYYLFYVADIQHLKPGDFKMFFLGKFPFFNNYYSSIKDYHDEIHFINKELILENMKSHKVPFFSNIFT